MSGPRSKRTAQTRGQQGSTPNAADDPVRAALAVLIVLMREYRNTYTAAQRKPRNEPLSPLQMSALRANEALMQALLQDAEGVANGIAPTRRICV